MYVCIYIYVYIYIDSGSPGRHGSRYARHGPGRVKLPLQRKRWLSMNARWILRAYQAHQDSTCAHAASACLVHGRTAKTILTEGCCVGAAEHTGEGEDTNAMRQNAECPFCTTNLGILVPTVVHCSSALQSVVTCEGPHVFNRQKIQL